MNERNVSIRNYLPEIRKKAETVIAFDEVRVPDKEINSFFGLEDEQLSQKELDQVRKFVAYAGRRLVAAAVFGEASPHKTKEDVEKALSDHSNGVGIFFSLHDSMHAAVTYERTNGASLVPHFLRKKSQENYLDAETNTEELKSLLWGAFIGKYPTFIALMDSKRKQSLLKSLKGRLDDGKIAVPQYEAMKQAAEESDPSDFESVRRGYERIVCSGVKMAVRGDRTLSQNDLANIDERIDAVFAAHEQTPNAGFYEAAKRIYDQYNSNPKVLFDEFKRTCTPLLEGLVREKRAHDQTK